MLRLVVRLACLGTLVACGSAETSSSPPSGPKRASATSPVETYFPLPEGNIFHYVTDEDGQSGMLVARVHRTDATHGELRMSNRTQRYVMKPDGIAYEGGAYILKAPLERGASWPGEHGGVTKVESIDAEVTVPAGHFTGCVRTVEAGRTPGKTYGVTYCPGVGMVSLEVAMGDAVAKAVLKTHGPPVTIPP